MTDDLGRHRVTQLDKVIEIDQRPIGRTPRSNPVTYIKVFDAVRDFFAQLPEARVHGYQKGRFSFNVKGRSPVSERALFRRPGQPLRVGP